MNDINLKINNTYIPKEKNIKKSNKKVDESNQEKNLLSSYISRSNKNVLYNENNKVHNKHKESSGFS